MRSLSCRKTQLLDKESDTRTTEDDERVPLPNIQYGNKDVESLIRTVKSRERKRKCKETRRKYKGLVYCRMVD